MKKNLWLIVTMLITSVMWMWLVSLTHNSNYTNPNQQYFEQLSYGTWTNLLP